MSEYYSPHQKIWNKAKMSTPTTTVKYSNGRTSQISKARTGNKRHIDWKRKHKMVPIFRWDDALLENSKESTDQLLELISEFNKVTGHKTNAYQKNQLYFYILTMNTWKLKLKIQYHLQSLKKKKEILRCGANKTYTGIVCWKWQNTDNRDQRSEVNWNESRSVVSLFATPWNVQSMEFSSHHHMIFLPLDKNWNNLSRIDISRK